MSGKLERILKIAARNMGLKAGTVRYQKFVNGSLKAVKRGQ